jgi:hypothetical protein
VEHGLECDGKSLGQRRSRIRDFSKYVWHTLSKFSIPDAPGQVNRRPSRIASPITVIPAKAGIYSADCRIRSGNGMSRRRIQLPRRSL